MLSMLYDLLRYNKKNIYPISDDARELLRSRVAELDNKYRTEFNYVKFLWATTDPEYIKSHPSRPIYTLMKLRDALKYLPQVKTLKTLQCIANAIKFLLDENPSIQNPQNQCEHLVYHRATGTTDEMLEDILSSVLTATTVINNPMFSQDHHAYIASATRDLFAVTFEIGDFLEKENTNQAEPIEVLGKLECQSYELMGTIILNWVLKGNNFNGVHKLRNDFAEVPVKSSPELCPICLENNISEENGYTILPKCNHNFCLPCFDKWFQLSEQIIWVGFTMFFLIGLGLGDPTDVGVLGQQIIKKCERVYLEAYTSILLNGAQSALEDFYGKKIQIADREQVEVGAGDLLENADTQDVALLVVGDPLSATTHSDLMLRAKTNGTPIQVLSNASVLTAAATTGLRLERFGEVVSIPYWEEGWRPDSFYDKIQANLRHGLHTLCLLDIKVKEQTVENIIKKRKIFEPPRFMRTHEAALQLLSILQVREEGVGAEGLHRDTPCVACVRLGTDRQQNLVTTLQGGSS
ncbi:Diphthine synthase [Trinorchestia longiramus]|nr:Diphthine synthase [Trinorchestia longiramus]